MDRCQLRFAQVKSTGDEGLRHSLNYNTFLKFILVATHFLIHYNVCSQK